MSLDVFNVLTDYLLQITIIQIIRMFFILVVHLCDLVDKIRDDDILFFSQILIEKYEEPNRTLSINDLTVNNDRKHIVSIFVERKRLSRLTH